MLIKKIILSGLWGIALLEGLTSCIYEEEAKIDQIKERPAEVIAFIDTRAGDEPDTTEDPVLTQVNTLLDDAFKDGFSILYIAQDGNKENVQPDFLNPQSDNLYFYQYYSNPSAWWGPEEEDGENTGGYNFTPIFNKALNWNQIIEIGKIGNGYVFCGMYFPLDNKPRFSVETDQTSLENHRKSNILAAKHTTANDRSRLRFRLYHMMVYLNVTLYVPVYDETDNSGYVEGAVDKGITLDINPNFTMDWKAETGADQIPNLSLSSDSELQDITMYLYPDSEETEIDVSRYYPDAESGREKVRKYRLGVLFPGGQDVGDRNFLRFHLHTPGGSPVSYVFSTDHFVGNSTFQLSKGSISNLELYLPRHENNTIVIKSNIIDWSQSYSNMTVIEETKNN